MSKFFKFGEDVEGYAVPVLNEREIRAAAGILFVLMFVAIMRAAVSHDFLLLKYAVVIFLTDISIRVFVNPRFSPTLVLGRLIVRNQVPEYVGAPQKKFAWIIGTVLATIMLVFQVIVNSFSPITGLICLICLVFLFFETSFGICLGCMFYPLFFKDKAHYCPGDSCEKKPRAPIQKTSRGQIAVVFGFAAYIVLAVFLFNAGFSKKPYDLFGLEKAMQSKQKTIENTK
jgi:hypothetical protein